METEDVPDSARMQGRKHEQYSSVVYPLPVLGAVVGILMNLCRCGLDHVDRGD
jgi:hypothetical protein